MGEKRKSDFTFLLKEKGKTTKIELFKSEQFARKRVSREIAQRYRVRVKGVWFPKGEKVYYTKWEFRDLLWRSLKL